MVNIRIFIFAHFHEGHCNLSIDWHVLFDLSDIDVWLHNCPIMN